MITSISPNKGQAAGGGDLLISGSGFTGATGVTFDGVAGTNFLLLGDTDLLVTTPAHALGAVDVTVDVGGTSPGGFTYVPTLTHAITGADSAGARSGLGPFSAVASGWGTSWNGDTGTVSVPAQAGLPKTMLSIGSQMADDGTIPLTAQVFAFTASYDYTVTMDAGDTWILRISVVGMSTGQSGNITGNGSGTVTGSTGSPGAGGAVWSDYSNGVEVLPATDMLWDLRLTVDDGGAGNFQVVISNYALSVVYENSRTLTDVAPSRGTARGGTVCTLTGTGLDTVTAVTFGGTAATDVVPAADGLTLTCISPAHDVGTVDVEIA